MDFLHSFQDVSKNWIMKQSWRNLLFAHWPVPVEVIRPFVPKALQIDTFERYAWIGIVVFVMDGIFLRGLPRLPLFAKFPEINVRTYVKYKGKPGVYFLSLDAPHWATYTIARKWYRLPYFYSEIHAWEERAEFSYNSVRKDRKSTSPVGFDGKFSASSEVYFAECGTLDHWLTERYCLYSVDAKGNIFCGEIDHAPWPLHRAEADICQNTLVSPFKFDLPKMAPFLHFSPGVDSIFSNIRRVKNE
ncbi:YqjF family protein [Neobacillus sp. SAB-20_R2A]|uniref:YqjF family protein n=1 Tax=Neobacillus sp. SAB-20_R2A TaxID=3120519 RepID=UPI003C6E83A7